MTKPVNSYVATIGSYGVLRAAYESIALGRWSITTLA